MDNSSSGGSRKYLSLSFILFGILMVFGVFAFWYVQGVNRRLDEIEGAGGISSMPEETSLRPTLEDPLNNLNARLTSLESLQEAIVSTSKSALEQMNFVFTIVASFFGLFALFFAYRQVVADGGREKHDEEMRSLVGSFRDNITVINALISTLEESFRSRRQLEEQIREQIKEINEGLTTVTTFTEQSERTFKDRVNNLNSEAFSLFTTHIDRQKFKSTENKHRLENFYLDFNTLEKLGDLSSLRNPFSNFLRGLHYFNITQYELAGLDFEVALSQGSRELARPTTGWYGDSRENEITEQLRRMLDDCTYHLGIIYYNLGEYEKAIDKFRETSRRDPLDFRSRSYIPELMFFDNKRRFEFRQIVSEFNLVEEELNSLSQADKERINWEVAMASLKMKKANCFLPKIIRLPERERQRSGEVATEAVNILWDAYQHAERIQDDQSLVVIFARFSLAQALEQVNRSEWKNSTPHELFKRVFFDIRSQIIRRKTEPILLVLLNYVLAICCSRSNIQGENPYTYLARAREHLQQVPNQVRIFSPINKINLHQDDLIWEIEIFEQSLT